MTKICEICQWRWKDVENQNIRHLAPNVFLSYRPRHRDVGGRGGVPYKIKPKLSRRQRENIGDIDTRYIRGETGGRGEIEVSHKIKPKKGDRKYRKNDRLFTEFLLQTYFTWCSFL